MGRVHTGSGRRLPSTCPGATTPGVTGEYTQPKKLLQGPPTPMSSAREKCPKAKRSPGNRRRPGQTGEMSVGWGGGVA